MPDPLDVAQAYYVDEATMRVYPSKVRTVNIVGPYGSPSIVGVDGQPLNGFWYYVQTVRITDPLWLFYREQMSIEASSYPMATTRYMLLEFDQIPSMPFTASRLNLTIHGLRVEWISDFDGAHGVGYLAYNMGNPYSEVLVEVFRSPGAIQQNEMANLYHPNQLMDFMASKDLTKWETNEPNLIEMPLDNDVIRSVIGNKLTLLICLTDYRIGNYIGEENTSKIVGVDYVASYLELEWIDWGSGEVGTCRSGGITVEGEELFFKWNLLTTGDGEVQPTDMYLALTSTESNAGTMGTELAGGGYSRITIPISPCFANTDFAGWTNDVPLVFPTATADWTVKGWAILDSEGRYLFYGNMGQTITVHEGVDLTIPVSTFVGALVVQIRRKVSNPDEAIRFFRALFTRDLTLDQIWSDWADSPRSFRYTINQYNGLELGDANVPTIINVEIGVDGHTGTNSEFFAYPIVRQGAADVWRLYRRNDENDMMWESDLHAGSVPGQIMTAGDLVNVFARSIRMRIYP